MRPRRTGGRAATSSWTSTPLRASAAALPSLIDAAERDGFAGLNITHPCKESVLPYLTDLSDDARNVGAVNTIVFSGRGRVGCNTDWWGFRESVTRGLAGRSAFSRRAARRRRSRRGDSVRGTATGVTRLDIVDVVDGRAVVLAERMNTLLSRARLCLCGSGGRAAKR